MSHPDLKDLLTCATAASHEACAHAMGNLHRRREADAVFQHDVKLALDRECQEKAEAVIRRFFPQHEILGEESATHERRKGLCWVIDPIDGTVNFSHGLRFWCNSIACQIDGRTVAAVVQAPALGELYTATLERPSELNGERIAVSTVNELSDALALTGLAKSFGTDDTAFDFLKAVGTRVRKVRLLGAAALDICQIAAGRVECFFEAGIYLWDIAAGDLIVQQAGGQTQVVEQLTDLKMRYFASNGRVHAELAEVLDGVLKKMKG